MPDLFRGITRIQDADDFTGSLTNDYYLKYSSGTGKFSLQPLSVSPGGSDGQVQYNNAGSFGGAALVTYATSGTILTAAAGATTDVPFAVNGAASQSGDLQQWKVNGTTKVRVDNNGVIGLNTTTAARTYIQYQDSAASVTAIFKVEDLGSYVGQMSLGWHTGTLKTGTGVGSVTFSAGNYNTAGWIVDGKLSIKNIATTLGYGSALDYPFDSNRGSHRITGASATAATWYANRFGQVTLSGHSATQTVTDVATVRIDGPTIAGSSQAVTITNNYSLWVASGTTLLQAGATTTVPLVIDGATSQSADLQQWKVNGTLVASISSNAKTWTTPSAFAIGSGASVGNYTGAVAIGYLATATANNDFVLGSSQHNVKIPGTLALTRGEISTSFSASQLTLGYSGTTGYAHFLHTRHNGGSATSNAIDWYTCDGTQSNSIGSGTVHGLTIENGKLGVGGITSPSAGVHVSTVSASRVGQIIQGTTSQTATLIQLQGTSSTTAGTAQAEIDTAWADSTHATRKARLLLRVYDTAVREGLRIDADGSYALTAIGGGTVTAGASLTVKSPTTTYVPLVVDSPASQSADLAQFKVNGTTVASLSPTPYFTLAFGGRVVITSSGAIYSPSGNVIAIEAATAGGGNSALLIGNSQGGPTSGNSIRVDGALHATYSADLTITSGGTYSNSQTAGNLHLRGGTNYGGGTNSNGGKIYVYPGAGSGTGTTGDIALGYSGSAAVGNLSLFGAGSFGSGVNVVFIANATTVPSTDPTGGGILYCEGGALKFRGSSGTVTTIAPA
jgi:hypothetical protein